MTLTARLLAFFLTTLAVVLIAFSTTLYFLASEYLYWSADEQLEMTVSNLAAVDMNRATEGESGRDDGSRAEQTEVLAAQSGHWIIYWVLLDAQGTRYAGSRDTTADRVITSVAKSPRQEMQPEQIVDDEQRPWLVMFRRVDLPARSDAILPPENPEAASSPRSGILGAGIRLDPLNTTRRYLALLLVALSAGIWLIALVCGRKLCRRALAPLIAMAEATDEIRADDRTQRLPSPQTRDELGELGRAFNDLLDRLQESFERQRQFTSDASHQLRTPLTAILGQAEVALRRNRSADEYRLVLAQIQKQSNHLHSVVEALLFLARSDVDAALPQLQTIDLRDWLQQYVGDKSQSAQYTALTLDAGAEDVVVSAHQSLLGELLDILVDNAAKYSRPGAPLFVRLRGEGASALIIVDDSGCGIDEQDRAHIFEPFFRSAAARRQGIPGVGLGLSIANRLAQALGGSIRLQNKAEPGSVFVVRLPRERADHSGDSSRRSAGLADRASAAIVAGRDSSV